MAMTFVQSVLSVLNTMRLGLRVTVATRSVWSKLGFPDITTRREIIDAAKAIDTAGNTVDVGGLSGTIGDVYTDEGFPTSANGGGPFGRDQATVYGKFEVRDERGRRSFRTFSFQMPWDTTLDQIDVQLAIAAEELESDSDVQNATLVPRSLVIA